MTPPLVHPTVAAVKSIHREVLAAHGGAPGRSLRKRRGRTEWRLSAGVTAPAGPDRQGEPGYRCSRRSSRRRTRPSSIRSPSARTAAPTTPTRPRTSSSPTGWPRLTAGELRYAAPRPAVDPSFIDEARKRFTTESACLDDRPAATLRFLAEANLSVVIRREEQHVDPRRGPRPAQRPHSGHLRRQDVRGRPVSRRSVRRARRGERRPPEAHRVRLRRWRDRRRGSRADRAGVREQGRRRFRVAGPAQPSRLRGRRRARCRRHAAPHEVAAGLAASQGARPSRRSRGASAGEDPRSRGPFRAGAGDRHPAVLPARLLPFAEPPRHARRGPGAH